MRRLLLFSILLIAGLVGSQFLSVAFGSAYNAAGIIISFFTMTALAFIMFHVGLEFNLDKSNPGQYAWDYLAAATAATFPWLFCAAYFVFFMSPLSEWSSSKLWMDSLLVGRFASPTSAGVLFSMLAAVGLSATWLYKKARILAILDDLDTILLMIPLKMAMVGVKWQLLALVVFLAVLLWLGWRYLHSFTIPVTWSWVLGYSAAIAFTSEFVYSWTSSILDTPIHVEVLLPAFVLGCVVTPPGERKYQQGEDGGTHRGHPEEKASLIVSSVFMFLVGLSMPPLFASGSSMGWFTIGIHVFAITVLSNIGKMAVSLFYKREASLRERLAISIGMFPRGEVGAGVLVVSLSYTFGEETIKVAALSLALNLLLSGVFIYAVKRLIVPSLPEVSP